MNMRKNTQNVMIKPTHDCNMNCDYCFVSNLTENYRNQRIELDTLNQAYKVLANTADTVRIIWHGGEPTMLGANWYKDAIELGYLYSNKTDFEHSMQSNGLLIGTNEWVDLIKNYGMDISVSYDGLYQDFRKKGTKETIEKNLLFLKENGINMGCLSVITEHSYKGMIDNYKYFKELGARVSFNYGINPNQENLDDYVDIPVEEFMKEYVKFFKYWINDREGTGERSCMMPINMIFGLGAGCCSNSDCRNRWVNINPDGSTYHCNRYFPEDYTMGNIFNVDNVNELYQTKGYSSLINLVENRFVNHCRNCEFTEYCKGGCNSQHFMNSGSFETVDEHYCKKFKLEFINVYKILRGINIYSNDNLNKHYLGLLATGKFTPREIAEFLLTKGINLAEFEFNPDELLNTKEFKLFRIFNPIGVDDSGHVDKMTISRTANINEITSNSKVRRQRFNNLEEIFDREEDKIFEILRG